MEESLLEFEEKKKTCTGPKACQKVKVKPIKGQKDIKTLFKKKESDLVKFTKDFNKVCLKNGIDVDSQQLQLAVALSKSLQPPNEIEAENIPIGKFVSSSDRSNRIRRTLQEYGFKVSGTNIKSTTNRRGKTCRKSYKLLLATEEEKSQNINERYKQVLYENPCKFIEKDELECKIVENSLFYLATNIRYEFMKNSEIFYVSRILCEISNTKGNLLKNWADIPGRPSSPIEREDLIISFLDMESTQAELDIMLSGTLKAAKDICRVKIINNSTYTKEDENIQITKNFVLNIESSSDTSESMAHTIKDTVLTDTNYGNNGTNIKGSNNANTFFLSQPIRSHSPDLFGEDDTTIIDDNVKRKSVSENIVNILRTLDFTGYEDSNIDQCIPQQIQNLTKSNTNDFMDLTECVPVALQKFENKFKSNLETTDELQLIQNNMEITECVNHISLETDPCACDLIDLTQHVDNSLHVNTNKLMSVKENSTLDLTQSSNSDDDLPTVKIYGTQKMSSEDTVVVNYDDYFDTEPTQKRSNCSTNDQSTSPIFIQEELKDNLCENESVNMEEIDKEDVLGHTSSSYDLMMKNISANNCDIASVEYVQDDCEDIDLTQSSDSRSEISDKIFCTENTNNTQSIEYNHLGKKDNVSIDYDDIHQGATINMYSLDEKCNSIYSKNANVSKTDQVDKGNTKNDVVFNYSNTSECFDLSDQELNYSTAKSTAEIFYVNKTLIIEKFPNIDNTQNIYNGNNNFNADRSLNESCVLSFDVNYNKGSNDIQQQNETHITLSNSTCSTPMRAIIRDDQISIQTPTHSEYVVKTGNITPMLDYGAMDSPERNRELEKYGLKPFKRKRAIQLLTHLYNQTHPIIEYCSKEPVPAKKFKPSSQNRPSAINESVDKDKDIQVMDMDKESIYSQTKDIPDIRNIECSDEDWVFQKKEKAKVYTCRVPLHIAFHNYVSCRRALREAILRYEPINIDVIHKDLISNGYKYNPKDLLKFLDKRCITVKTADNNGRNSKK